MAIKSNVIKPIAAAVGVAFVSSLVVATTANANDNPFAASDLDAGYMLASSHEKGEEGKCGEGKCGEKDAEGHDGEKGEEGSCGESDAEKGEEGNCGESDAEGHDGEKGEEGSCGESDAEKGEGGTCGNA